jgi:hypothetical protein
LPSHRNRPYRLILAFVLMLLAGCPGQAPEEARGSRRDSPSPRPVSREVGPPSPFQQAFPPPSPFPELPDDLGDFSGDFPPQVLELAAVGDVNLGARVGEAIASRGPDYPWREVAGSLRRADLAIVNFECAASTRGTPAPEKEFTYRADPASVPAMAQAGVDVASVANNHAVDFGVEAFSDTLTHLREAGVAPVGGGANVTEAWQPYVVERKGLRSPSSGPPGSCPTTSPRPLRARG